MSDTIYRFAQIGTLAQLPARFLRGAAVYFAGDVAPPTGTEGAGGIAPAEVQTNETGDAAYMELAMLF